MATIKEDMQASAAWIVEYFKSDRILLDYSIDSFRSIDIFFEQHAGSMKTPAQVPQIQQILFSLGAYVGETLLRNISGANWIVNENEPQNNLHAAIKLSNGKLIVPMQRIHNRFNNGSKEGIYTYGASILKEIARENYWNNIKSNFQYSKSKISGKRWRLG